MYEGEIKEIVLAGLGIIALAALGFFIYWIIGAYQCQAKWSSFINNFGIISECQINVNGKWIPADSYYFKEE